eukprot:2169121-Alexandrium_andersonii.AAC.1
MALSPCVNAAGCEKAPFRRERLRGRNLWWPRKRRGARRRTRAAVDPSGRGAVSYTHLTLPTICSV